MINYGKKSLLDAINNNLKISNVYTTKKQYPFLDQIKNKNFKINIVSEKYFDNLNNIKHQFIAYEIEKRNLNYKELLSKLSNNNSSIVLIVDSLEDPRNFGSILRTCDAFNIDAVFYKKDNQASINEVVKSVSMGATNYLDVCEVVNLNNLINDLKKIDFWIYATTLKENSIPYYNEKFPNKIAIIVGNENKGISDLVSKNSDVNIYIPMDGHVQSLNVSVATGIILSHLKYIKNK